MKEQELRERLGKILDRYVMADMVDGRYSPKPYVGEIITLFKEAGYVKLAEDQSQPEFLTLGGISGQELVDETRKSMLKANFRKVELWK